MYHPYIHLANNTTGLTILILLSSCITSLLEIKFDSAPINDTLAVLAACPVFIVTGSPSG